MRLRVLSLALSLALASLGCVDQPESPREQAVRVGGSALSQNLRVFADEPIDFGALGGMGATPALSGGVGGTSLEGGTGGPSLSGGTGSISTSGGVGGVGFGAGNAALSTAICYFFGGLCSHIDRCEPSAEGDAACTDFGSAECTQLVNQALIAAAVGFIPQWVVDWIWCAGQALRIASCAEEALAMAFLECLPPGIDFSIEPGDDQTP